jgi:hypothetical protein
MTCNTSHYLPVRSSLCTICRVVVSPMGHPRHLAIVVRTPILTRRCKVCSRGKRAAWLPRCLRPPALGSLMALIVPLQFASSA